MKSFKLFLKENKLIEGYTEEQWRKLDSKTKAQYIKDHPTSKYAQQEKSNDVDVIKNLNKLQVADKKSYIKKIINDKNVSPSLMKQLSDNKTVSVRVEVASSNNISKELLNKLSQDPSKDVKAAVAFNHKTPKEILTKLSKENDKHIIAGIAQNPNTPTDILANIYKIRDSYISKQLRSNPNIPEDLKDKLDKRIKNYEASAAYFK